MEFDFDHMATVGTSAAVDSLDPFYDDWATHYTPNEYVDSHFCTKLVIACLLWRELRKNIGAYALKLTVTVRKLESSLLENQILAFFPKHSCNIFIENIKFQTRC